MRSVTGQFPVQIDVVGRGLSPTTPVCPQPLSDRDSAILLAIDQYRYLDSDHIADLFHLSQRKAQLCLKNLLWRGVIYRWSREQRQGSLLTPAVYVLSTSGARHVASLRGQDPRPVSERARRAREQTYHLRHDLAANGFFTQLAAAARERYVKKAPRGARWGRTTMCGNEYEEGPAEMVVDGLLLSLGPLPLVVDRVGGRVLEDDALDHPLQGFAGVGLVVVGHASTVPGLVL